MPGTGRGVDGNVDTRHLERVKLTKATMLGWAMLDAAERDRFFEALVAAALRLDRLQFREWLWKRLRSRPLVAVDPTAYAISDGDMTALPEALDRDRDHLPADFIAGVIETTAHLAPSE
jgi:hypothetical protein